MVSQGSSGPGTTFGKEVVNEFATSRILVKGLPGPALVNFETLSYGTMYGTSEELPMKILRNTAWRTISFVFLAAGLLALGVHTPVVRAGDQAMPAVNTAAPDFTLNSQEGMPVSLHDYR